MARRKTLIDKVAKKRCEGKCYFCDCDNYALLDVHRIKEGHSGGKYSEQNSVVACSLCHRKIHAGLINIDRKYLSSSGRWVLHYFDENGMEHFK